MAKRKRGLTPQKIAQRIQQGRGRGHGKTYKPWLTIQDVPSRGQTSRVLGSKTGRCHELLSLFEKRYFYVLELSNQVEDIREQYPLLPLAATQAIAAQLGIKHPADPQTRQDIVMTTDFLVTIKQKAGSDDVEVARTLKFSRELFSHRVLEKLEIERIFWQVKRVDWGIVTDQDITRGLSQNARLLHAYLKLKGVSAEERNDVAETMKLLLKKHMPLNKAAMRCDQTLGYSRGTSLRLAYHLLATGCWPTDLHQPILPNKSLILLKKDNP